MPPIRNLLYAVAVQLLPEVSPEISNNLLLRFGNGLWICSRRNCIAWSGVSIANVLWRTHPLPRECIWYRTPVRLEVWEKALPVENLNSYRSVYDFVLSSFLKKDSRRQWTSMTAYRLIFIKSHVMFACFVKEDMLIEFNIDCRKQKFLLLAVMELFPQQPAI